MTENLFLEEGDMVQWYPKGSQTTFKATIEVEKRLTDRKVIVIVQKEEKYKIKDMMFFVYKVLDEPLKMRRERKNTRGRTVILLPFCEGYWSYEPNGDFARTRLPFTWEYQQEERDNSFLNDLGLGNDEMAVLADKSELAIIRGRERNERDEGKGKDKVKLGYYSFGIFTYRNEFDPKISFWNTLRHNLTEFKWHHGGTNRYGDYQLKPIDDPIHGDSDSDNILDSDSDDDYDSDSDDDDDYDGNDSDNGGWRMEVYR